MDNETDQCWQESESPQIISSFLDMMKTVPAGPTESIYTEEVLDNFMETNHTEESVDIRFKLLETIWRFPREHALQLLRLLRCEEGCVNVAEEEFFNTIDLLIDRWAIEKSKKSEDFIESSPLKHKKTCVILSIID